ncbi:Alkaline phosphatase synthesis transcriptional regulatory protein phoP [Porphyromonas macacae]|uniref:Alkaline phosphatase synthesis transcriptional regulatory protein phoP n=1 Tax=Porphyromonas macacae TaxID=28115 RepID=A0A379DHD7_9PORP|nr:response regulator transcription factor [Porphyromonas macacae]SUB77751.1 Alkaline phosphatase synthesis transcriptional regulatory protein phoP [Porphyromonas macacae]
MNTIKALLAEDEATLSMILSDTLETRGITLQTAADGETAWQAYAAQRPDILIVDVMMPKLDGFSLVKRIRESDKNTPIIFLTARGEMEDILHGFDIGADDYMCKPFNIRELEARIKALARRRGCYPEKPEEEIPIGSYRLNRTTQQLTLGNGQAQQLSYRESELLWTLASNSGQVVEAYDLLMRLWGDDDIYNRRSLHVFISHLRDYLRNDASVSIVNIRSIGYKLLC